MYERRGVIYVYRFEFIVQPSRVTVRFSSASSHQGVKQQQQHLQCAQSRMAWFPSGARRVVEKQPIRERAQNKSSETNTCVCLGHLSVSIANSDRYVTPESDVTWDF